MRPKRSETHRPGYNYIMIVNCLAEESESFTLEQREIIRQLLFTSLKKLNVQLVAWTILPRSYRILVRAKLNFVSGSNEQKTHLIIFMKKFQQRIAMMTSKRGRFRWASRYRSIDISPDLLLTAMASIDAAPLYTNIATRVEDYFFTSFYHAKFCADDDARKWILKANKSDETWAKSEKKYALLLNKLAH